MTQQSEYIQTSEQQLREDLAACYRLVALYGWDDLIFTHISARVPGPDTHFLINPYGMMFDEITASSLVKVDLQGQKIEHSNFEVNPAGFIIHSAIHEGRHDANCVLHLHTNAGVAVSAQQNGLLPISQQSLMPLSSLSYHNYEGIAVNAEEKIRLQQDLGQSNFMILRNHGLLTTGETIADAFLFMYILQRACEIQIMAGDQAQLIKVAEPIQQGIKAQADLVLKNSGGALAWPALLRKLDRENPGFRD